MNAISRGLALATVALSVIALGLVSGRLILAQDEEPEPEWVMSSPSGGPAYQLAVSPRSDDLVQSLFAASTEVMSSTRAADWVHVPGTLPVANIVAGPGGVAYAATAEGDHGYRTTTYGKSWRRVNIRGEAPMRFVAVSPDYDYDDTAYGIILGEWRLYRTTNDANTWQEVKMEADVEDQVGAVAFSPLHNIDETVFVGTDRGIFKWSAENRRWTLMSQPGGGTPAFGEAGGPASSQGLVVPAEYGDDPCRAEDPVVTTIFAYNAAGVYRSDNEGATWTEVDLPAGVTRVNGLALSNGWPKDPVLVVAFVKPGAVGAVSTDDGQTWQVVPGRDGLVGTDAAVAVDFAPIPECDEHWAASIFLPHMLKGVSIDWEGEPEAPYIGSREMFIATDGDGVYCSTDAGATWQPSSSSFTTVRVTALDFLPGGAEAPALAGSEVSGLYRSEDGGKTWAWLDSGLPRGSGQIVHALQVSPDFESDRTIFVVAGSGVWVSRDGGVGWNLTSAPQGVRSLAISPAYVNDRTVLASGQMSTDAGVTWAPMGGIGAANWSAVAFSPVYPTDNTIWAGTDQVGDEDRYGLHRSSDGGATWELIEATTMSRAGILSLHTARYDVSEDIRIFAGTTRGLFASYDDGETWRRQGATSRPARDVTGRGLQVPYVTGVVLSATQDGAMWSVNRGADWTRDPRSPKEAWSAAVSTDGEALLVGLPVAVGRFELEF